MSTIANFQISLFTNNSISIDTDTVNKALSMINSLEIGEFIPNIVNNHNINILEGKIEKQDNISFVTLSQEFGVVCLDERLDFNFNKISDYEYKIDDLFEIGIKLLNEIIKLNHIFSNRLAVNIHFASKEIDKSLENSNFNKVITSLGFYEDGNIIEWSSHINKRENIFINKDEIINIITEFNSVLSNDKKNIMLCHLDINTIAENNKYRFGKGDTEKFFEQIHSFISTLEKQFKELEEGSSENV